MTPTSLRKPGVYLFRPPAPVVGELDRELLILFTVTFPKLTGAVLYLPNDGTQNISSLLEALLEKMQQELEISPSQIAVKIFGMSAPQAPVILSASKWFRAKGLRIVSIDIGKNVTRRFKIDTQTGLIGVTYVDKHRKSELPFLSHTTAQSRDSAKPATEAKVLVLADSPTTRLLAKQAVEENSGWKATVPADPEKLVQQRTAEFHWGIVLLFDGLEPSESLLAWLSAVAASHPSTRFGWAGDSAPRFSCPVPLETFPPLTAERPMPFKAALKGVAENPLAWPAAGTLAFRKPFKKRL